ncbi:MAG: hypothetical protein RIS76_477 [Verrucomicrobiota bacterium]
MIPKSLPLILLSGFMASGAVPTRLLNIDFGNAAVQGAPRGKAAVGISDSDVWNLSSNPFISEGEISDLVWSTGSSSGAGMKISNAPGAWVVPVADPMFNIYAYSGGGPITVTVTGLPAGVYDLLAYGHGEVDSMSTRFEVNAGGGVLPSLTTGESPRWRTLPFQEGEHYVTFRGLVVREGLPVVLTAHPTSSSTPFLNGIQFAAFDDPGTQLINIDFGNSSVQGPPVGKAATGISNGDLWNLSSNPFIPVGSITNLIWSDGSKSGASMFVTNAPGAWTVPVPDPMFKIYAYSYGGPIVATISDLREGVYDVFAYGHGERDELTTRFSLSSGAEIIPDQTTGSSPRWRTLPFAEGEHYVVFRNVNVVQGVPLIVTANETSGTSPFLNGLQLLRHSVVPPLEPPVIMPQAGLFTNVVNITFTTSGSGRQLRYTLDGTEPTESSSLYTEPFQLRASAVVAVRRYYNGAADSATVYSEFKRVYAIADGIPTEWRLLYFGAGYLTDPRVGAGEDPDNDGATNLSEYVAGTDPLDPLSGFTTRVKLLPAIEWVCVPGKAYRVLRKKLLTDPTWSVVSEVTATGTTLRFVDESADGAAYYYTVQPVR